jgi:hypothetical protein
LVKVETTGSADEGFEGGPSLRRHDDVSCVITLFEQLVVDDRPGFFALTDMASQLDRLAKGHPESRPEVAQTQGERIDASVGFTRDDVLRYPPWSLPSNRPGSELVDNRSVVTA